MFPCPLFYAHLPNMVMVEPVVPRPADVPSWAVAAVELLAVVVAVVVAVVDGVAAVRVAVVETGEGSALLLLLGVGAGAWAL